MRAEMLNDFLGRELFGEERGFIGDARRSRRSRTEIARKSFKVARGASKSRDLVETGLRRRTQRQDGAPALSISARKARWSLSVSMSPPKRTAA